VVEKPEGKKHFDISAYVQDNIKRNLKEVGWEYVD
jgi:hypothetical protein